MIQNYEKHSCLAIFHLARKSAYKGPGSISELERHWELTKTNTSKDQLKKKKKNLIMYRFAINLFLHLL